MIEAKIYQNGEQIAVFRTKSSEKPHALQPWDESRAEGRFRGTNKVYIGGACLLLYGKVLSNGTRVQSLDNFRAQDELPLRVVPEVSAEGSERISILH